MVADRPAHDRSSGAEKSTAGAASWPDAAVAEQVRFRVASDLTILDHPVSWVGEDATSATMHTACKAVEDADCMSVSSTATPVSADEAQECVQLAQNESQEGRDMSSPPRVRARAATEWALSPEPLEQVETSSSVRPRARSECFATLLQADISGEEDAPGTTVLEVRPSPEWEADWSAISTQLQPHCYRIGESHPGLRLRQRRSRMTCSSKVTFRIATNAEELLVTKANSDRCGRRTRARTMSDGFPVQRRSRRSGRGRAPSDGGVSGVYGLDWSKLAAPLAQAETIA